MKTLRYPIVTDNLNQTMKPRAIFMPFVMKQILVMILGLLLVGCGADNSEQLSGLYLYEFSNGPTFWEELDVRDDGTYTNLIFDNNNDPKEKCLTDRWVGKWKVSEGFLELDVPLDGLYTRSHCSEELLPIAQHPYSGKDNHIKHIVGLHKFKIQSNGDVVYMSGPTGPAESKGQSRFVKQ